MEAPANRNRALSESLKNLLAIGSRGWGSADPTDRRGKQKARRCCENEVANKLARQCVRSRLIFRSRARPQTERREEGRKESSGGSSSAMWKKRKEKKRKGGRIKKKVHANLPRVNLHIVRGYAGSVPVSGTLADACRAAGQIEAECRPRLIVIAN